MVRGVPLRSIGKEYQTTHATLNRHRVCIADELKGLKAIRSTHFSESLLERLNRYRLIAEKYLDDDEKALLALDRCYKQVDIEAKLTGEYQKKQENKIDAQRRDEIIVEAYKLVFAARSLDDAVAAVNAVYGVMGDSDQFDAAVRAALDSDKEAMGAVWSEAERRVDLRSNHQGH
jgi:hypothetical protein